MKPQDAPFRKNTNNYDFLRISANVILVIGLIVGFYYLGFVVRQDAANREYGVNTHTQQYQAMLLDKERAYATQYNSLADGPQKAQMKSTFCATYLDLTQPPADLVAANSTICN